MAEGTEESVHFWPEVNVLASSCRRVRDTHHESHWHILLAIVLRELHATMKLGKITSPNRLDASQVRKKQ